MRNESEGYVGKSKVSPQNTTSVLKAFRENQDIEPGDYLGWYHRETDEGDVWEIRQLKEGGE